MLLFGIEDIRIVDLVDILIVSLLVYQLYKLLKGTIAFNIFIGIMLLYAIWLAVSALDMKMLTFILGPFVGFGVLIVIIIFQQEVRQFLLILGNTTLKNRFSFFQKFWGDKLNMDAAMLKNVQEVIFAMTFFQERKIGALIIVSLNPDLPVWSNTGQYIDSNISAQLLKSIFQKQSPLHDGATILVNNRIHSASVIMPLTEKKVMPSGLALRHRAAVGVSEKTRATAFVVSEENGEWSMASNGILTPIESQEELKQALINSFVKK